MERHRHNMRVRCSGSTPSEESALDLEKNCCGHSNLPSFSPPTLQPFASAGQHCESNAAYFSWPSRLNDAAEERANYFLNLQKGVLPETLGQLPKGHRATTLLELMTIRAFHSKILRCYSLGTAIGFRIRRGVLTDIPAILVFVSRKVHKQWLSPIQCLPTALEGPGGVWCDVDVVEFSYFGTPEPVPKEQHYTEIVDDLRGGDPCIGSGSQVASQETYGTLGAIVRSQTGSRQVGFLTNRHVAVDLDYPNQKMFHPLPPTLGPGVYLGAVERATSFITDELWYGIFAGINPETFVRADGAFIPFADDFDMSTVTNLVRGVGDIGDVKIIDLQAPISSLIGKRVVKVGRSSGLTTGIILAYALEYNDEKGICFLTDFLVVGENQQTFDLEGDSGSLIMLKGDNGEKPQPIGIIWGGTANRGRLKLKIGQPPENWTSGVDLGRLLNLLELDLITTDEGLKVAVQEQITASATVIGSTAGDSSPPDGIVPKEKAEDKFEPLGIQVQSIPLGVTHSSQDEKPSIMEPEFKLEDGIKVCPSIEHQFIPSFGGRSRLHKSNIQDRAATENLSSLRNDCDEDFCVSLQLGDNEAKRRRSEASTSTVNQKMERHRHNMRVRCSGSTPSEESALDLEKNGCSHSNIPSFSPPTLQPFTSAGQHCESSAAYFSWPSRLNDAAEERANYFINLQKGVLPETLGRLPKGHRATTLLELMTIRAFHSKILRCYSLGTAIGFRIRRGVLTDIPAILVFVSRKVHKQWLSPIQCLPTALEGPGGVWCDVDVVEFSYFGAPEPVPKEQLYTEIVDDLRGGDPCIGSGSQVASLETYGTLGAIVRSQTGSRQVGFLTNRHVAVDLDYPNQKMFHPLPPTLGPGVYLGAVERATSFITDELWYGIFAGINPETFVRADGAFIPFADDFDMSTVTTSVRGVGDIGDVKIIDLQAPVSSLIGKQVVKVGRSSGLTTGIVLAYALEYNDERGICFLTDFLVVGENQQTFDLEGDSGSLIMLKGDNGEKPQPIGIIWGGTANRGRLKLKIGQPPENWTSGVDLGRLLNLLELDLITTDEGLRVAVQEQRTSSATVIGSSAGDSSPPDGILPKDKAEDKFEPLGIQIQSIPLGVAPSSQDTKPTIMEPGFKLEDGIKVCPSIEHQFIPSFGGRSPLHKNNIQDRAATENLFLLRNGCDEDLCVSLQLGDNEAKRRRSEASTSTEEPQ